MASMQRKLLKDSAIATDGVDVFLKHGLEAWKEDLCECPIESDFKLLQLTKRGFLENFGAWLNGWATKTVTYWLLMP